MFTLHEKTAEFERLDRESKGLAVQVLARVPKKNTNLSFPTEHCFNSEESPLCVYMLKEGFVRLRKEKRVLYFHDAGDLIAAQPFIGDNLTVSAEGPVIVDEYSREELLHVLANNRTLLAQWHRYEACQRALHLALLNALAPPDSDVVPETRVFDPGDPIIIEGSKPGEVFTLLHGTASVFVKGVLVGEILQGEIFGAMAATSNMRRSASVVAKTPCVALALPKEHFLALARSHPATVLKLVDDMARVITDQNDKIVRMTN